MKTLGWEQAAEWSCRVGLSATVDRVTNEYPVENGGTETVSRINKSIYFPNEDPTLQLTLPMPEKPYQVAYLANALLPYSEALEMSPCLLWLTDFGFWSVGSGNSDTLFPEILARSAAAVHTSSNLR